MFSHQCYQSGTPITCEICVTFRRNKNEINFLCKSSSRRSHPPSQYIVLFSLYLSLSSLKSLFQIPILSPTAFYFPSHLSSNLCCYLWCWLPQWLLWPRTSTSRQRERDGEKEREGIQTYSWYCRLQPKCNVRRRQEIMLMLWPDAVGRLYVPHFDIWLNFFTNHRHYHYNSSANPPQSVPLPQVTSFHICVNCEEWTTNGWRGSERTKKKKPNHIVTVAAIHSYLYSRIIPNSTTDTGEDSSPRRSSHPLSLSTLLLRWQRTRQHH